MKDRKLKHPPIVEAIVEIQWGLVEQSSGMRIDPHFKFLLGKFHERVKNEFPEYEQLPTASFPEEIMGHIVQHRFRVTKEDWPLVQIGPGIFTFNETEKYRWDDFKTMVIRSVGNLLEAYPKPEDFHVEKISLRYINALTIDSNRENVFNVLRDKMKISLAPPETFFTSDTIDRKPLNFIWQSEFRCNRPEGVLVTKFTTGRSENTDSLIWETIVQSFNDSIPRIPDELDEWFETAHAVSEAWFFKTIEGELERRFSGE